MEKIIRNIIDKNKLCSQYQDIFIVQVTGGQLAFRIGKTPVFVAQSYKRPPSVILSIKNGICNMISIPDGCQMEPAKKLRDAVQVTFAADNEALERVIVEIIEQVDNYYERVRGPQSTVPYCLQLDKCQEAKKCLQQNDFISNACRVRRNIERGRIYGK